MAKRKIMQTTPYDIAGTLVFFMPKISAKFEWGRLQQVCQMQVW